MQSIIALWSRTRIGRSALAYGSVMLASSAMNNVFVTYYIEMFTGVSRVPTLHFHLVQLVFMLWNAVNDPLFGWLSDDSRFGNDRRRKAIRYGGVLWCTGFLMLWFPWGVPGSWMSSLHFLVCLCLYDTMLSVVEVNHSAVLAESAASPSERAVWNSVAAVGAAVGSLSNAGAHMAWDPTDLHMFRLFSMVIALFCCAAFHVAGTHLPAPRDEIVFKDAEASKSMSSVVPFRTFVQQISRHRNLRIFVVVSSIQSFDCAFEKCFLAMTVDRLAGAYLAPGVRGLLISASFLLPHVGTVVLTPVIRWMGIAHLLSQVFFARLCLITVSLVSGGAHWSLLCLLVITNRIVSETVCRVFPLVLSDLVDEDRFLQGRKKSMSSSVIGVASFFPKFGQSLAAMLGVALVSGYSASSPGSESVELGPHTDFPVFSMLLVPAVCITAQLAVWRRYTLRGAYQKQVQEYRDRVQPEQAV